jgi:hypothetical protein
VILEATDGNKKRKRRRKQAPTVDNPKQQQESSIKEETEMGFDDDDDFDDDEEDIDIATIKEVANFSFDGKIDNMDTTKVSFGSTTTGADNISSPVQQKEDGAIPLPDIKDTLRRKELEAEMARMEEEQETNTKKIDRKDRKALLKVS